MHKFQLTFKTPDVEAPLQEIAARNVENSGVQYSEEELEYAIEDELNRLKKFLETWISYGEYVTIEFDEKNKSARVCQ